jgi:hypothetical protein
MIAENNQQCKNNNQDNRESYKTIIHYRIKRVQFLDINKSKIG